MYWKNARGFFTGNSSSYKNVFDWFFSNMGTSTVSGTSRSNIQYPIALYFSTYCGGTSAPTGIETSVTYNKIKAKTDADIPLYLSLDGYSLSGYDSDEGGHAVNVWGCNTMSSGNYLFITNNWSTNGSDYPAFSLINYDTYPCAQFVYCNPSL